MLNLNIIARQKSPPPFRFEKLWCFRKDFDVLIKRSWCKKFSGSFMYQLMQKCKSLKENIKDWNKTKFGNIFRQIQEVDCKLVSVQSHIISNSSNLISFAPI